MPTSLAKYAPGTFEFIEQQIRQDAVGTAFGTDFEWLCRFFLTAAPQFKGVFKSVWLWGDWPGRWGADKGIDLVAETVDGPLWAIQAKAVRADRSIPKSELDSFLSESNRPQFDYRLIIATTDDIGRNARDTIAGQEKPVGLVLRGELLTAEVHWPARIGEKPPSLPRKNRRPHQIAAIKDVTKGFRNHDRGQLIMACGTGKTLTALWIAEMLASRRTLVLVPSLSLISQTLIAWGRNCAKPFDYLVVCSDETVIHKGEDAAVTSTSELGVPVTTDVATIQHFLGRLRKKPAVVFATYQSSDRVAAAQAASAPPFDLVLADEAHRCTGPADGLFTTVLDAAKIKARRRLFLTATPRYFTGRVKQRAEELEYELASMDDEARFGPVFHRLTFDAAIDADLLTDYQVVVIGVTQAELRRWAEEGRLVRTTDGMQTDARTLAAQIGLAKAMRQHDLRKIITFHSSVAKASRFTDAAVADSLVGVIQRMSPSSRPSGQLWTGHISGQTPAGKRSTLLTVFANLPDASRGVLSNCACLGEGVDVPVLDGVAFIDPKRSMIDIIQAVGRVIRKADDKRIGTVVIPVFVDESEDADHALSHSAFEPVWQVLKALRAHDQKLADEAHSSTGPADGFVQDGARRRQNRGLAPVFMTATPLDLAEMSVLMYTYQNHPRFWLWRLGMSPAKVAVRGFRAETNKVQPDDRPVHDWYRFVLSFPPHLVRDYLDRFCVTKNQLVLDPFCGTGTTLVECKKKGIPSVGVEANPMAHFASTTKTDWRPSPETLLRHANKIADDALELLRADGLEDDPFPWSGNGQHRPVLLRLPSELDKLLLTNSISPLPLHKTLVLRGCLERGVQPTTRAHLRLALAKAIVGPIGNLHFGPEVGVGKPKSDAAAVASWLTQVRVMADDLEQMQGAAVVPTQVCLGDARALAEHLRPRSIDAVITSPPYPNEKDYTRTTRLESVLLGMIGSKDELRQVKKGLVRSNTRSVYKADQDDALVADHPEIQRIAKAIETRRLELGKTSGFERLYPRVTKLYFGGMSRHLASLRPFLRAGAMLAYVVGDQASYLRVMIRTGQILADIAQSLGYRVETIDLFRTRLATATREQLREEVVILKWPGKKAIS